MTSNASAKRHHGLSAKVIPPLILAAAAFLALAFYSNFGKLLAALASFNLAYLAPVLALALANYVTRFFRWQYYLRQLRLDIGRRRSAGVFFSGLAMSATPGKVGELLKCFMLKESEGIKLSTSAPVVIAERYTDLVAVVLLLALGVATYPAGRVVFAVALAIVIALFVAFTGSERLVERVGTLLSRFWLKEGTVESVRESVAVFRRLLRGRRLLVGTVLGFIAWSMECIAFYLVLLGFGWHRTGSLDATFIYASATVIGALSMLPGGLVATEGSMTALLVLSRLPRSVSSAATLVVRVCTLWFAVVLGLIFYLSNRTLADKAMDDVDEEGARPGVPAEREAST